MSLPARQRRALNEIEKKLDLDHPGLGPLFATFTRLTGHEAIPATEQVTDRQWQWQWRGQRRWRLRPGVTTVVALALATVALFTLSLTLSSQPMCAPGTVTAVTARVRSIAPASRESCAAQPGNPSTTSQSPPYAR